MQDEQGVMHYGPNEVQKIVVDCFSQLFTGNSELNMEPVLECINPCVTEDMNDKLCSPYLRMEVDKALQQMNLYKAPGPD